MSANIFMQFDTAIEGNATEENHIGWMPLTSASFSVDRMVNNPTLQDDRNPGTANFGLVMVTMEADKAATELMFQAASGGALGNCTIDFVQTSGTHQGQITQQWILGQTLIASYSNAGAQDGHPQITMAISYTTFTHLYNHYPESGSPEAGTPKGVDLKTGAQI